MIKSVDTEELKNLYERYSLAFKNLRKKLFCSNDAELLAMNKYKLNNTFQGPLLKDRTLRWRFDAIGLEYSNWISNKL